MFDSRKKLREEQIEYLSRIKPTLQTASEVQPNENKEILAGDDFANQLNKLSQRVNALEQEIENEKEDSVRKVKIKEQILSLLGERKKLSSSELSNLINLSRTRCNEYFRELSKEGLAEGVIVGRQKYYKSVRK
jgi:Fic family protein